jgi:hypothetical protein
MTPRGLFRHNVAKARLILNSQNTAVIDPRQAPKTWAFWRNLWKPVDPAPVTLDSWMLRAHGLPANAGFASYRVLADAYRVVARDPGLVPNQVQATVWLYVKKI